MPERKGSTIQITDFKARCLRILDEVGTTGRSYTVTKRGKPVARVVPVASEPPSKTLGRWQGIVEITGDIVHGDWSQDFEAAR